eukprot:g3032.t1
MFSLEIALRILLSLFGTTFIGVGFHQNDRSSFGAALQILGCSLVFCPNPLLEVILENCNLTENQANVSGGAIYASFCNLSITSSEFQNNDAALTGGAIHLTDGPSTLRITNSSFENNRVISGLRTENVQQEAGLPLELFPYFTFHAPGEYGGAVSARLGLTDPVGTVEIEDSLFRGNRAEAGGALAIIVQQPASDDRENVNFRVEVRDCLFIENKAERTTRRGQNYDQERNLGGAIYSTSSATSLTWTLINSTFVGNRARHGAGLHLATPQSVMPQIQYCNFEGNEASGAGGGLLARNTGSIQLEESSFSRNTAAFGGGIMLTNGAMLRAVGRVRFSSDQGVVLNRFISNFAVNGGGLMCTACGDLDFQDTVFYNNTADDSGGGIYCLDTHAPIVLSQMNITNNRASQGGGAAFLSVADVEISASDFDGLISSISNNEAEAGAGIYIKSNRQQENRISIQKALISNNTAIPLNSSKPVSSDCSNGGGGGICLVLDSIPEGSIAEIRLFNANFTNNRASVGGGLFVEVSGESWNVDLSSETCADPTPSTDSCRLLAFSDLRFVENIADSGGGAMFVSNLEHVVAGCVNANLSAHLPLSSISDSDEDICLEFHNNTVADGTGEYGPNIATRVYSLYVTHPLEPIEGLTGGTTILPPCNDCPSGHSEGVHIAIKDAFNQTITGGILESQFHVSLISGAIMGEQIYEAKKGVFNINGTIGTGINERHQVLVQLNENISISTSFEFSTRDCYPGETIAGNVCEQCEPGTYSFDPKSKCRDCPDRAQCAGNSSLVPIDGYWHSSPFSTQFHSCIVKEACSYPGRNTHLEAYYDNTTQVSKHLAILNSSYYSGPDYFENYEQCQEGYKGVLCGSCQNGYGHIAGGECVECSESRGLSALIVILLVAWVVSVISILSFLASLSAKKQIKIAQQNAGPNISVQMVSIAPGSSRDANPNTHLVSGSSQNQCTKNVDHIIALQKVTEVLKIFINYFQVTSTALSIDVAWLNSVKLLLAIQTLLASIMNGSNLVPLDCSYDQQTDEGTPRSIQSLWLRIALPFMILLVLLVAIFLYYTVKQPKPATGGVHSRWTGSCATYCIMVTIVVIFYSYIDVTSEFMRSINCIKVDEDSETNQTFETNENTTFYALATGRRFWAEDTDLRCFKGNHTATGVFGILGMIFFSLGVIVFFPIWILRNKVSVEGKTRVNADSCFIARYGYIYQGYDCKRDLAIIWETVVFIRKAMIAAVVVFAFQLGANLQAILALGVLILALIAHLIVQPFDEYKPEDSSDVSIVSRVPNVPLYPDREEGNWAKFNNKVSMNWIESASLINSIIVFYSGILFNDSNTSEAGKYAMAAFVMIVNLAFILYIAYRLYAGMVVALDLRLKLHPENTTDEIGYSGPSSVIRKVLQLLKCRREKKGQKKRNRRSNV